MDFLVLAALTAVLGACLWFLLHKLNLYNVMTKKVDEFSPRHGGQLVAEVSSGTEFVDLGLQ
jgi:prolipoprotein diacylglyceryltransferase